MQAVFDHARAVGARRPSSALSCARDAIALVSTLGTPPEDPPPQRPPTRRPPTCPEAATAAAAMAPASAAALFEPLKVGDKTLKHRVVYAPLTR